MIASPKGQSRVAIEKDAHDNLAQISAKQIISTGIKSIFLMKILNITSQMVAQQTLLYLPMTISKDSIINMAHLLSMQVHQHFMLSAQSIAR